VHGLDAGSLPVGRNRLVVWLNFTPQAGHEQAHAVVQILWQQRTDEVRKHFFERRLDRQYNQIVIRNQGLARRHMPVCTSRRMRCTASSFAAIFDTWS